MFINVVIIINMFHSTPSLIIKPSASWQSKLLGHLCHHQQKIFIINIVGFYQNNSFSAVSTDTPNPPPLFIYEHHEYQSTSYPFKHLISSLVKNCQWNTPPPSMRVRAPLVLVSCPRSSARGGGGELALLQRDTNRQSSAVHSSEQFTVHEEPPELFTVQKPPELFALYCKSRWSSSQDRSRRRCSHWGSHCSCLLQSSCRSLSLRRSRSLSLCCSEKSSDLHSRRTNLDISTSLLVNAADYFVTSRVQYNRGNDKSWEK